MIVFVLVVHSFVEDCSLRLEVITILSMLTFFWKTIAQSLVAFFSLCTDKYAMSGVWREKVQSASLPNDLLADCLLATLFFFNTRVWV